MELQKIQKSSKSKGVQQLSGKETLKSLECFNMGIRRQDGGWFYRTGKAADKVNG